MADFFTYRKLLETVRSLTEMKESHAEVISEKAQQMINALDEQDSLLEQGKLVDVMPIVELNTQELYQTKFGTQPVESKIRKLPYLNPDKRQVGAWGWDYVQVNVYEDGTAIAVSRGWLYAYRSDEMTLDGCPKISPKPMKNECVVKFYLLGCKHEYEEQSHNAQEYGVTLLSMDHLHVCKKCKHQFVVNTSD